MDPFYTSVKWLRLRAACFERDGFRCRRCGNGPDQGAVLNADHILPRRKGGKDELANLQTLCRDCNGGKLNDPPTLHDQRSHDEDGGREMLRAWKRAAARGLRCWKHGDRLAIGIVGGIPRCEDCVMEAINNGAEVEES
jgi:5-methylcytosine-specific restriction endonuclease McrA